MVRRRPAVAATLLAGLLLLLPGHVAGTAAVYTDAAASTTGEVGASTVFVPPAANPVSCVESGPTLNPGASVTFTTDRVAEPPRGGVQYVLRVYRVDVTPATKLGPDFLMNVGPTTATLTFDGGGLTLLQDTAYQARVTTRLTDSARESSPARLRNFRNGGLLIANFTCGTGT
ncbi:hypothetical protein [Nocardioides sp. CFH 31398]|uniref:hypothetical protein n=1 Tax=Nocardioides sp. CFH 31398 TaxID=2919579 RepID=UPI001F06036F|nr:hypothetical protein [Nocardioides sp. CFH 31398]MCH1867370.1 hypothetical protein [Nocardioides sp. CFH 31398]MCH1868633.1 hypothetical protein [Nocardioides sp. CFH 31398]